MHLKLQEKDLYYEDPTNTGHRFLSSQQEDHICPNFGEKRVKKAIADHLLKNTNTTANLLHWMY